MDIEESKGFKSEIGKQKAENKAKKKDAKTQKQRRQDKIDDLNSRPRSWSGLESRDIRTPAVYFQNREITEKRIQSIKKKLDDLTDHLQSLRRDPKSTPAVRSLASKELGSIKKKQIKERDINNAVKVVNSIADNDVNEAVDQMKDALDEKIFRKVEPYMKLAGGDIEKQIFGNK